MEYYNSRSVKETREIAQKVIENLNSQNVILLQGELGAGKTTFSQNVLDFLGAKGPFTSPTFVIMKKYDLEKSKFESVYHFDCYRVGSRDILELGWEEIINNPRNLILVEWPEKIEKILSKSSVKIFFKVKGKKGRGIKIEFVNCKK